VTALARHGKIFSVLMSLTAGALAWPAALIVWGPGETSTGHSHHCVQLVMAMHGTFRIRARSGQTWMRCGAALVRPDSAHEVDARHVGVLIAFVDPESELGAALSERITGNILRVSASEVARWRVSLGRSGTPREALVARWARNEFLHGRRSPKVHPGVRLVLQYLRKEMGAFDDLSLPKLASIAGLSQSRFMHAFTESVGTPLRPYILWLRLQLASRELVAGTNITETAHRAGFSDGAHLSRTFRRMLGTTPSEIAQRTRASRGISLQQNDAIVRG
jgi:AraC-like DNA-binding protein